MLPWFSESKDMDTIKYAEDDQMDQTCIDAPETPAPVFAVRAFKQLFWGTPQPETRNLNAKLAGARREAAASRDKSTREDADGRSAIILPKPEDTSSPTSPTKPGILLTPGTIRVRRKDVTFGADVVDNEGKKPSRSGLPNNVPGKFPSPWTPKAIDVATGEKKPNTKLTRAFFEAQSAGTTRKEEKQKKTSDTKQRAKDDADITLDIMEPRSESGRYWKEQYMSYSHKSEEETKKLIAKQKLAKEYARKKDAEAIEALAQLESERKHRQERERQLELEIRDLRERLRKATGQNAHSIAEVAILRKKVETSISGQDQSPQVASHDSFLIPPPTPPATTDSQNIWEDAAAADEYPEHSRTFDMSFQQANITHTQGEKPRSTRVPRRLNHKAGTIGRQTSMPSANKAADVALQAHPSETTTLSQMNVPGPSLRIRRTLGERNPNLLPNESAVTTSPPPLTTERGKKKRKTEEAENYQPFDPSTFLESFEFDSHTTLEALGVQANETVTQGPSSQKEKGTGQATPVSSTHKRLQMAARPAVQVDVPSEKVPKKEELIPSERAAKAKERLAAKRRAKENVRSS